MYKLQDFAKKCSICMLEAPLVTKIPECHIKVTYLGYIPCDSIIMGRKIRLYECKFSRRKPILIPEVTAGALLVGNREEDEEFYNVVRAIQACTSTYSVRRSSDYLYGPITYGATYENAHNKCNYAVIMEYIKCALSAGFHISRFGLTTAGLMYYGLEKILKARRTNNVYEYDEDLRMYERAASRIVMPNRYQDKFNYILKGDEITWV